jgi:hypothetical protein
MAAILPLLSSFVHSRLQLILTGIEDSYRFVVLPLV